MSEAGWVGRIERVDGGQSRMGSLGAGWWRVSRDRARRSRRGVGSMVLVWHIHNTIVRLMEHGPLWFIIHVLPTRPRRSSGVFRLDHS